MKVIVCELCGSNELVKQPDGLFQCQECGTKYTVEAARSMLVDVEDAPASDFDIVAGILEKYTGSESDVVIPDGVTKIGKNAFRGSTITSVVIPEGVTEIENRSTMVFSDGAFRNCRYLKKVVFPESLKSIGNSAFQGCASLEHVELPSGLERLGNFAFSETGLTSFTLPAHVKNVGFCICSNCNNLAEITVEDGVSALAPSAFSNAGELKEVVLPESVKVIDRFVFSDCEKLERIYAPGVTSIGEEAFYCCNALVDKTFGTIGNQGANVFGNTTQS